jgi:hypothetical protein
MSRSSHANARPGALPSAIGAWLAAARDAQAAAQDHSTKQANSTKEDTSPKNLLPDGMTRCPGGARSRPGVIRAHGAFAGSPAAFERPSAPRFPSP